MVNFDTSRKFDNHPASFEGIPSLTINHDATINLDSTNAFEGPEKLLEIWFASSSQALSPLYPHGLKAVPQSAWTEMLDLVSCKILSIIRSSDVDSYLLSESSMFVWPHKLILKTCGTTTLLLGLQRILQLACEYGGFQGYVCPNSTSLVVASPTRVFYSRKNYLFPERQRGPHRSWGEEVAMLDRFFLDGSAYLIGKMNGEHWYLYVTMPKVMLTPPASPPGERVLEGCEESDAVEEYVDVEEDPQSERKDETLEILMTDLDEENARQFYLDHASAVAKDRYQYLEKGVGRQETNDDGFESDISDEMAVLPNELTTEGHALGNVVADASGLLDIYPVSKYPDARVDSYLFNPCGFSANGVIPAPDKKSGTHYFTVHVTPEPQCSYASFETNVPRDQNGRETREIIESVVEIFKPGRFTVTFFEGGNDGMKKQGNRAGTDAIAGYRRTDRIVHDLDGYDLVFRHYEKIGFARRSPQIGENGLM